MRYSLPTTDSLTCQSLSAIHASFSGLLHLPSSSFHCSDAFQRCMHHRFCFLSSHHPFSLLSISFIHSFTLSHTHTLSMIYPVMQIQINKEKTPILEYTDPPLYSLILQSHLPSLFFSLSSLSLLPLCPPLLFSRLSQTHYFFSFFFSMF